MAPGSARWWPRAYAFADRHHADQKRLSDDPYVTHVIEAAGILHGLHSDPDTLAAALLHDCLEDTSATLEDIQKDFGPKLAELVDGVTKISTRVFRDRGYALDSTYGKMTLAVGGEL